MRSSPYKSPLGAKLLSSEDPVEAQKIAELLDRLNRERKTIETAMLEEAIGLAEQQVMAEPDRSIVIVGS